MSWSPPRAIGAQIIVQPHQQSSGGLRGDVGESGLVLGRVVEHNQGTVLSLGSRAQKLLPEVSIGDSLVFQRDHNNAFCWRGVWLEVVNAERACPHCDRSVAAPELLAVDDGMGSSC